MKCHKCKYEWEYKGKLAFASCPSCISKVKVKQDDKQNQEL